MNRRSWEPGKLPDIENVIQTHLAHKRRLQLRLFSLSHTRVSAGVAWRHEASFVRTVVKRRTLGLGLRPYLERVRRRLAVYHPARFDAQYFTLSILLYLIYLTYCISFIYLFYLFYVTIHH